MNKDPFGDIKRDQERFPERHRAVKVLADVNMLISDRDRCIEALRKIKDLWDGESETAEDALDQIEVIAEMALGIDHAELALPKET